MTFNTNASGEFIRMETKFRNWIRKDGSTQFTPEKDRYHLYISWACPWANRTAIMRRLKKLDEVIGLSVVSPIWNDEGWTFTDQFPGSTLDTVNHQKNLIDIYRLAEPAYGGEETVPVLWDKKLKTIVNNESLEIIRMLDLEFQDLAGDQTLYYTPELASQIDETIRKIYRPINNGVYRAGFARSQEAYETAVTELFAELEHWEEVLGKSRYLCGPKLTEADICLFTTLFRFDIVYHGHFKCNLKRLRDFPNLWGFTRDVYQLPGIQELCSIQHCKSHYYVCHRNINPTGIVPLGPEIDYSEPHGREDLKPASP